MPFKGDLQELMKQFGGPMTAVAGVQGVAGVVLGVVYRNPDEKEPSDEVALLIIPKVAQMERAVCQVMVNGLTAQLEGTAAQTQNPGN